jgi:DHA1 family bicyclomycin/chloramphenicol resistance-like MFS transporter
MGMDVTLGERPTGRAGASRPGIDGRVRLVLLLGGLIALGPLSIDLYLPALPGIAHDLRAGDASIQFTLTGMLAGLAIGQVLVGPLSDAVGRRRPLIVGSALHVAASLACALAPTVELLAAARVLQGLGASAGAVLGMAVATVLLLPSLRVTPPMMIDFWRYAAGPRPDRPPSARGYAATRDGCAR